MLGTGHSAGRWAVKVIDRYRRVLGLRDARIVILASAASAIGSSLTVLAVPLLLFERTASASLTSLAVVTMVLPQLVFGLPAGAVADRVSRRKLLVFCVWSSAGTLVALAGVTAFSRSVWPVLLLSFPLHSIDVLAGAAGFAVMPALVGRENVVEAQSVLSSLLTAADLLIPPAGAALFGLVGPTSLFLVDSVTFMVVALAFISVKRQFLQRAGESAPLTVKTLFADMASGLRYLFGSPVVRNLTLTGFCNAASGGVVYGLLIAWIAQEYGLLPGDARVGVFYFSAGFGGLFASLTLPFLRAKMGPLTVPLVCLSVSVVFIAGMSASPNWQIAAAAYGLFVAMESLVITNGITARQQLVADQYQSRVGTAARMIAWGGAPVGAALAGASTELVATETVVLGAAIPCVIGIGMAAFGRHSWSKTRKAEELPVDSAD